MYLGTDSSIGIVKSCLLLLLLIRHHSLTTFHAFVQWATAFEKHTELASVDHLIFNPRQDPASFNGSQNVDMHGSTKQHSFLFSPPFKTTRNYLRKF